MLSMTSKFGCMWPSLSFPTCYQGPEGIAETFFPFCPAPGPSVALLVLQQGEPPAPHSPTLSDQGPPKLGPLPRELSDAQGWSFLQLALAALFLCFPKG